MKRTRKVAKGKKTSVEKNLVGRGNNGECTFALALELVQAGPLLRLISQ